MIDSNEEVRSLIKRIGMQNFLEGAILFVDGIKREEDVYLASLSADLKRTLEAYMQRSEE